MKKIVSLLLAVMLVLALAGCAKTTPASSEGTPSASSDATSATEPAEEGEEETESGSDMPEAAKLMEGIDTSETLEYSCLLATQISVPEVESDTDVVTPFVEDLFNIKCVEVLQTDATPSKELLSLRVAADDAPDVCQVSSSLAAYAYGTGHYADLTEYVQKMENLNKYFDQQYWNRFSQNGEIYRIPCVMINQNDPEYASDPLAQCMGSAVWVREDILAQLGYSFTPLDEIAAEKSDKGIVPTVEDYAIDPPINTPDDLTEFLRKVKALNLKVGDIDVIPFTMPQWATFHSGSMYDYGHWRMVEETGKAAAFLGSPEAKDWYNTLNTWYQEGLLDPDVLTQTDDVRAGKINGGLVAAGFVINNVATAASSMAQVNPDYKIRYIPMPSSTDGKFGCFDLHEGAYWGYVVSNRFTEEELTRLTQYFDWFYSEEGFDILTWGPESAGLWEYDDEGKKVFKSEELVDSLLNGSSEGQKGTEYYGLYTPARNQSHCSFFSRAGLTAPTMQGYNPFDSRKSYPICLPKYRINEIVCTKGFNTTGQYAYSDGSDVVSFTNEWFWNTFNKEGLALLLSATDKATFDSIWEEQMQLWRTDGQYDQSEANMTEYFNSMS